MQHIVLYRGRTPLPPAVLSYNLEKGFRERAAVSLSSHCRTTLSRRALCECVRVFWSFVPPCLWGSSHFGPQLHDPALNDGYELVLNLHQQDGFINVGPAPWISTARHPAVNHLETDRQRETIHNQKTLQCTAPHQSNNCGFKNHTDSQGALKHATCNEQKTTEVICTALQ